MTKRRRKYTQEFKEKAVKLVCDHGNKISEAAKNLGIHPNLLSRWKREIEGESTGSKDAACSTTLRAELNRLRKENKQLREIVRFYWTTSELEHTF